MKIKQRADGTFTDNGEPISLTALARRYDKNTPEWDFLRSLGYRRPAPSGPRSQQKHQRLIAIVSDEDYIRLVKHCARTGVSQADVIRTALREYLDR